MPRLTQINQIANRCAAFALACFAAAIWSSPALAQEPSWSLMISEKEAAISDPTNTALQNFLMWDLSADRVMHRNMPYLELQNNDPQPITELRITIGDERFNFDCAMLQECAMVSDAPAGISVDSSVIAGDELVLNFGNGGLPTGESVRFKIALGVDDGFSFFHRPDFRTVLFDMNEINVYDGNLHLPSSVDPTDDNSHVTVTFGTGATARIAGPIPFEDFNVFGEASKYFNDHFRRYGVMEQVDTFLILGGVGGEIPEPTAVVLAIVALGGGLSLAGRSRRQMRKY
jgi:hypothetical protein